MEAGTTTAVAEALIAEDAVEAVAMEAALEVAVEVEETSGVTMAAATIKISTTTEDVVITVATEGSNLMLVTTGRSLNIAIPGLHEEVIGDPEAIAVMGETSLVNNKNGDAPEEIVHPILR